MKTRLFLFAIVSLSLFSCKKTEIEAPSQTIAASGDFSNGVPSEKINGYLYACDNNYNNFGYLTNYAVFSDPARMLYYNYNHREESTVTTGTDNIGNVSVGSLQFSGYNQYSYYQGSNTLSYYYSNNIYYQNLTLSTAWLSEGNKSFAPINVTVPRGFPILKDSLILSSANRTINVQNGYNIVMNQFIGNYDSLYVKISNNNGSFTQKMFTNSQAPSFSSDELKTIFSGSGITNGFVEIAAFNYSNKLISGKRFVFELAKRRENIIVTVNR